MMAAIERDAWSGDGDFTIALLEALEAVPGVAALRVEDAPASGAGTGYNLVANEIFVTFSTEWRPQRGRWLGVIPVTRLVPTFVMTLADLESRLASVEGVGAADYSDDGMLQYLRTERIIPPYQTKGYKLVEMVRIYRADQPARPKG